MSTDELTKYSLEERNFASAAKLLREARDWSQAEMGRALVAKGLDYMNQMTVSRIEKLQRPVRMIEAQAYSEVFDVPIWKLMHPEKIDEYIESMRNEFLAARTSWRRLRDSLGDWEKKQAEIQGMAEDLYAEAEKWDGDQSRLRELQRLAKALHWYSNVDLTKYLAEGRTEQDGEHSEAS